MRTNRITAQFCTARRRLPLTRRAKSRFYRRVIYLRPSIYCVVTRRVFASAEERVSFYEVCRRKTANPELVRESPINGSSVLRDE